MDQGPFRSSEPREADGCLLVEFLLGAAYEEEEEMAERMERERAHETNPRLCGGNRDALSGRSERVQAGGLQVHHAHMSPVS